MKITKTKTYSVGFSVQYFHPTEGGMDNECYGPFVDTMEEALDLYDQAMATRPKEDWVIVGTVVRLVTGEKK